jgi:hypothetical protein
MSRDAFNKIEREYAESMALREHAAMERRQQAKDMAEALQKLTDALGASPGTGHAIAAEFLKAVECKHDATKVDGK